MDFTYMDAEEFANQQQDEFSSASPPDWSQLNALWPSNELDSYGLNLGMDFDPSMAVDPTALHFDSKLFSQQEFVPEAPQYPNLFPFTFSPPSSSGGDEFSDVKPRRLSDVSAASSFTIPVKAEEPAEELARRVREAAGLMNAVEVAKHQAYAVNMSHTLKRPYGATSSSSSTTCSPPPSDRAGSLPSDGGLPYPFAPPGIHMGSVASSSASPEMSVQPLAPTATTATGRPKTSHTTIERRYRTNLNARIQSLRYAVPALRILEDKGKSGDVADSRGFIDGVKVARKGSKANVLGKAVEYIRVLKKRENRLVREQSGLKSLVSGLVGGPALLGAWEQEWKAQFGGPEKDEVEGEEEEAVSDDEDDEDPDEDGGRAKKKLKVTRAPKKEKKAPAAAAPQTPGDPSAVPEKRKRGRPRKVVAPIAVAPPVAPYVAQEVQMQHQQTQPQPASQYMLATFALFSFFNSPLSTSTSSRTSSHGHTGSVLSHHATGAVVPTTLGWRDFVQAFHLLVSALVFFSIVLPWLPSVLKRSRVLSFVNNVLPFTRASSSAATPTQANFASVPTIKRAGAVFDRTVLLDALAPRWKGTDDEVERLRAALGVRSGISGLVQGLLKAGKRGTRGFEQRGLEQRAWVRLGELVALDASASATTRLHTYWRMSSHISWFTASTSDLVTLALIIRPIAGAKASMLWTRATKAEVAKPYQRLVLSSMTVQEAAEHLSRDVLQMESGSGSEEHTPLGVLSSAILRSRVRSHTAKLFVRTVLPDSELHTENGSEPEEHSNQEETWFETVDAAKSLGGRTGELADMLEVVWKTGVSELGDVLRDEPEQIGDETQEADIRALVSAVVLYRRIFPSSASEEMLSPPPSPSRKDAALHMTLRQALGSSAFEGEELLEDARDRVVDMLVDYEYTTRASRDF